MLRVVSAVLLFLLVQFPCPGRSADLPCPVVYAFKGSIMLLTPGESQPRKLGTGHQPALAAGGAAVWISGGENPDKASIMLYDPAGRSVSLLARPGGYLLSPRFSPDGGKVLFLRATDQGRRELWTVAISGGKPARLIQSGGQVGDDFFEPMFEPTGDVIVYQDMTSLYRLGGDGRVLGRTALAGFSGGRQGAFTSSDRFAVRPGGGQLAFSMPVEGTREFRRKVPDLSSRLFLYDPATKSVTPLAPEAVTAFDPVWTPDGSAVFFTGYTDKQAGEPYPFRVMMVRPGQEPVQIAPGESPMPPSGK